MRICLINNTYAPFDRGGADRVTSILADEIRRKNIDLTVVSLRPFFSKVSTDKAGETNIIYFNSFFPYLHRLPKALRFFWHLGDLFNIRKYYRTKKILTDNSIDLVISNNLKGLGGLAPLAIKQAGCKHCHILHDIQLVHPSGLLLFQREDLLNSIATKIYAKINQFIFRKSDLIISPSQWLIELHKKFQLFRNTKTMVKFNPTENKFINSPTYKTKPFDVIFIGEITKEKGIETLLAAVKQINQRVNNFRFHVVGKGSVTKLISDDIKNLTYYGYLPHNEVEGLMKKMNCLILPSLCYENSPTVLFESIQSGMPFLCSELGGNIEIANLFNGLMFIPGNTQDLINKLLLIERNYGDIFALAQSNKKKLAPYSANLYLRDLLIEIQ